MKRTNQPPFWRSPRFRYGGVSTLLLALALMALIAVCALCDTLEQKNGWRVDYSFNAMTTQSQTTLDVLANLEHPVHIYALYARGNEDQPLLELLNRYSAASPLVTWEQTDISLNPGLLSKFRSATAQEQSITDNSLIVSCEDTGRWKVLSPADFYSLSYDYEEGVFEYAGLTYEGSLTSAIHYVSQETIPRVMVLQGHGELDEDSTAALAQLLSSNNYDVFYFTLDNQEAQLQPGDLLMMLSPIRDLTDQELAVIQDFIRRGGSILFTCDYSDPLPRMPNYASLLRSYGFEAKEGMVIASAQEEGTYYNGNRTYLVPTMCPTDITDDLVEGHDTFLVLAGSRAFALPGETDRALTVKPVLTTGYQAYLRAFTAETTTLSQQEGDELGPFALALQAQRVTDQGEISRAFVLGASSLLISTDEYALTVSQEFIIRTVEFLLNTQPRDLGIVAKLGVRPHLSAVSVRLGSLLLVLLPVSILAAAVIVLGGRRK